ncbi:hypothetical protein FHS66_000762 [Pacificitalea manganoxidans]|nr:hypothetical protein [Pacificitalea manganoxidans]
MVARCASGAGQGRHRSRDSGLTGVGPHGRRICGLGLSATSALEGRHSVATRRTMERTARAAAPSPRADALASEQSQRAPEKSRPAAKRHASSRRAAVLLTKAPVPWSDPRPSPRVPHPKPACGQGGGSKAHAALAALQHSLSARLPSRPAYFVITVQILLCTKRNAGFPGCRFKRCIAARYEGSTPRRKQPIGTIQ